MSSFLRETRRVNALFKAFSSDYLLREQFVTDPAQILNEYVHGARLEPESAAIANHFIYAVVSNPGLLEWVRSYGRGGAELPDGDDFTGDLASALARHGDEQSVVSVLRAAKEPSDLLTLQTDTLRALILALRQGGSSGGTEMSPGRVFAGTEMSSPGTEMSPGRVFAGTEMSSPGTEMSSPGTEHSIGGIGDLGIESTLSALVAFATQLRKSGELNGLRFR